MEKLLKDKVIIKLLEDIFYIDGEDKWYLLGNLIKYGEKGDHFIFDKDEGLYYFIEDQNIDTSHCIPKYIIDKAKKEII